jgi:DNA-binding SARP family transcriptional activator
MSERQLRLLGRFDLVGVQSGKLGEAGQRLTALLAVRQGVVARWQAAQLLYAEASEDQAAANLRAVIWRMRHCVPAVIDATGTEIRLAADISVDYWAAARTAHALIASGITDVAERGSASIAPGADRSAVVNVADPSANLTAALRADIREDILPGWPEPWLVTERERFHQLRLHALELLCIMLIRRGQFGAAVDAGLAVVAADPLRESGQRALIDAYLAEGNACDAIRQYDAFRVLLHAELGLLPTDSLRGRMAALSGTVAPARARTQVTA